MIINKILQSLSKKLHNLDLFLRYGPKDKPEMETVETFGCCAHSEGRGSKVTELPNGISLEDLERAEKAKTAEEERIAKEEAIELQKTIIQWQKLAGVEPEKTLDLLIPIKEGKTERRRSVNFNCTSDMVAFLQDKGFVPYDLEYIEEARTGKYRFIRIKKNEVPNFFEFPDATFNGPEFYTPYKTDHSRPIIFGPYLAPHQLSNPIPMTAKEIEDKDGKISVLAPLAEHAFQWKNEDGIFYPKTEIDYLNQAREKPTKDWIGEMTKATVTPEQSTKKKK